MRVAVLIGMLAGCYQPAPSAGAPCGPPDFACPSRLTCLGDRCVVAGGGDEVDGSPPGSRIRPSNDVDGALVPSPAGGGGGDSKGTNGAGAGQRGLPSTACAAGDASTQGAGGKGGCLGAAPTSPIASGDDRGGGGAAGRIALRGLASEISGAARPAAEIAPPELE